MIGPVQIPLPDNTQHSQETGIHVPDEIRIPCLSKRVAADRAATRIGTLIKTTAHFTFCVINLLKPTGHVMRQQFNIQQLYALPTLYLCVLYLSENKQRLVPLTA